jgi:DNA-binding response OmpR family regulator
MSRILIVEDDHALTGIMTKILKRQGIDVEVVNDARLALERARAVRPGLILLDLALAGYDGQQIFGQLRADPDTQAIPILLMSGDYAVERRAAELGADGHLWKPFSAERLLEAVKRAISEGPPA